jgi:hypothetical protein
MNISAVLEELRNERDQIEAAIIALKQIARARGNRRGRPPKWLVVGRNGVQPKRRGRPPGSKNKPKPPQS